MEEFSIEKPRMPKLTGPNYRIWSIQAKLMLQAQDLWGIVESAPEAPKTDEAATTVSAAAGGEDTEKALKAKAKEAKASFLILSLCGTEPQYSISELETAHEKWEKLKEIYAPVGAQQLGEKLRAFNSYAARSNDVGIAHIIADLDRLQAEIGGISPAQKPSNEAKAAALINVVSMKGQRYDSIISQIEIGGITAYDKIAALLTNFERRFLASKPAKETALQAEAPSSGRDRSGKAQKGQKKKFSGECHYCGKPGHKKADCFSRKRDEAAGENTGRKGGKASTGPLAAPGGGKGLSPPPQDAHVASETSWVAKEIDPGAPEHGYDANWAGDKVLGPQEMSWVIDSGCTRHMTYDRESFTEYHPLDRLIQVNVANGATIDAVAEGTVSLQTIVNGSKRWVKIHNVLHVPDLSGSLISVSHLQDRGIMTRTTDSGKMLLELNGRTVGTANRIGRSYVLSGVGPESAIAYRAVAKAMTLEEAKIWHRRYGHLTSQSLRRVHTVVDGITSSIKDITEPCDSCRMTKSTKVINRQAPERATRPLERVHSDIWGPYRVAAINGATYFVTFTDEYTRKSWVYLATSREQLRTIFTEFRIRTELESSRKVTILRCDNGGEYKGLEPTFSSQYGIKFEYTTAYTPHQNGVSERLNRSLVSAARAMINDACLPYELWGEAVMAASYLRNRTPIGPGGITPEEAYTGKKPSVSHLRAWGCVAYAHLAPEQRNGDKLAPNAIRTALVGYMPTSKQYRLYDPDQKRIIISTSPRFEEGQRLSIPGYAPSDIGVISFDPMEADPTAKISKTDASLPTLPTADDAEDIPVVLTPPASEPSESDDEGEGDKLPATPAPPSTPSTPPQLIRSIFADDVPSPEHSDIESAQQLHREELSQDPAPTRSGRQRNAPRRFDEEVFSRAALISPHEVPIPRDYESAVQDPIHGAEWAEAIDEELKMLQSLGTWEPAQLPKGKKTVGCRWVFNVKYTPTGLIDRFKARLVAQGFSQVPGDDYLETFSPTIRAESLRLMLAIGAAEDLEMHQIDVVSAYPRSDLHAEIYMRLPEGLSSPTDGVLRILKSLYGLKQSGREWYIEACAGLKELGLGPLFGDPSIFATPDRSLIIGLYVDDMLIMSKDAGAVNRAVQHIKKRWAIKNLGEVNHILGLRVIRDRANRSVSLDQTAYIDRMIERFGLSGANPCPSPAADRNALEKGAGDEPEADQRLYQEAIGCLNWVTLGTRFDAAYVSGQLSQHCSAPTIRNWNGVLHLMRYLMGTRDLRLTFGGTGGSSLNLQGFCDADYAGDRITRRSVTGHLFLLNGGLVSWASVKQRCVATSTAEAEYIALAEASKQGQWLRSLLKELRRHKLLGKGEAVPIFSDNQACIAIAENPIAHRRTKHIDVRYHYIRQLVSFGKTTISYIPTKDMKADILTKPLPLPAFRACIGGSLMPPGKQG